MRLGLLKKFVTFMNMIRVNIRGRKCTGSNVFNLEILMSLWSTNHWKWWKKLMKKETGTLAVMIPQNSFKLFREGWIKKRARCLTATWLNIEKFSESNFFVDQSKIERAWPRSFDESDYHLFQSLRNFFTISGKAKLTSKEACENHASLTNHTKVLQWKNYEFTSKMVKTAHIWFDKLHLKYD